MSNQDLWAIARSALSHQQQMQMQILVEFQSQRPLTPEEQAALESLREECGRVTLRKARAYALLSLRGGRPLLSKDSPNRIGCILYCKRARIAPVSLGGKVKSIPACTIA